MSVNSFNGKHIDDYYTIQNYLRSVLDPMPCGLRRHSRNALYTFNACLEMIKAGQL
jgi:hypothetical protein